MMNTKNHAALKHHIEVMQSVLKKWEKNLLGLPTRKRLEYSIRWHLYQWLTFTAMFPCVAVCCGLSSLLVNWILFWQCAASFVRTPPCCPHTVTRPGLREIMQATNRQKREKKERKISCRWCCQSQPRVVWWKTLNRHGSDLVAGAERTHAIIVETWHDRNIGKCHGKSSRNSFTEECDQILPLHGISAACCEVKTWLCQRVWEFGSIQKIAMNPLMDVGYQRRREAECLCVCLG